MATEEQLQQEVNELIEVVEERDKRIEELENEMASLKESIDEIYEIAKRNI